MTAAASAGSFVVVNVRTGETRNASGSRVEGFPSEIVEWLPSGRGKGAFGGWAIVRGDEAAAACAERCRREDGYGLSLEDLQRIAESQRFEAAKKRDAREKRKATPVVVAKADAPKEKKKRAQPRPPIDAAPVERETEDQIVERWAARHAAAAVEASPVREVPPLPVAVPVYDGASLAKDRRKREGKARPPPLPVEEQVRRADAAAARLAEIGASPRCVVCGAANAGHHVHVRQGETTIWRFLCPSCDAASGAGAAEKSEATP